MTTLIAEDLLLLLLDDEKGTAAATDVRSVLGGAVLVELALSGAVTVGESSGLWQSAKVGVVAGASTDDRVLQAGLETVAERPRSAQDLVGRLGKDLKEELAERLVARGVLERREEKVWGLFPRTRWPAVDSAHEGEVRSALTAALVHGTEPDQRTAALIALLSAIDRAHKVVDLQGTSARDVRRRAKEIAEGAWAAKAVKDAIDASTAAIVTVIAAASVAGSSGA